MAKKLEKILKSYLNPELGVIIMGRIAHHWLQEGIEKERARRAIKIKKEKINISKKMLTRNKPLDEIIDFTGLKKEEIEKLKT